jgi:hypothetical protein
MGAAGLPRVLRLTDIIRPDPTLYAYDSHPDGLPVYTLTCEEDEDCDEGSRVEAEREPDPLLGLPALDLILSRRRGRRRIQDAAFAEEGGACVGERARKWDARGEDDEDVW